MNEYEQTTGGSNNSKHLPFLLLLFIGSGCSALIYEVVWFQMLQLVIGSSAISLGILLGTYMGGMFLGSMLLPRLISAKNHPLRVYGILELGIGIIGVLALFGIPYLNRLYIAFIDYGFTLTLFRGLICAICLLPPTIMMGATLPAIARWIKMTPRGVSWLGFFYGGNTAGAVFGCLLTGFYLLRRYDVYTATYVAVSINGVVALLALFLAYRTHYKYSVSFTERRHVVRAPGFQWVYLTIMLSGFCALGAEVVWTRILSLLLGGNVYTFSIILAVFLIGLGIGSSIGSILTRMIEKSRALLGICQLLLTTAIAWVAFSAVYFLPYWPLNSTGIWGEFLIDLFKCVIVILPASLLWGASFPLAVASVVTHNQDPGKLVGEVYAANTFGSICGAVIFSLIIIPRFGTYHAQQLMIWVSGISALLMAAAYIRISKVVFCSFQPVKSFSIKFASVLIIIGLTLTMSSFIPGTQWEITAYGRNFLSWADDLIPGIVSEEDVPYDENSSDIYCTYFGEGMSESVAVTLMSDGVRNFHASGKVQASSFPEDMRLQRMLGHITTLTHGNPKSALVIGCGAGVTAGTFVLYPDIERLVICEIEELVPSFIAPQFEKENYNVVNDPRTEVIIDDGRHFVQTTHETFDIITSDPIDPWMKGSAVLYTEEFLATCREHLNPGGIMALWVPFYGNSSESVKSLIATFFSVFPDGIVWSNETYIGGYDAVIYGQAEPKPFNIDDIQQRLDNTEYVEVANSLNEVGFDSAIELFGTFAGYGPQLKPWLQDAQINSDRNLRLQYLAGMSMNYYMNAEILDEILVYYSFPYELFRGSGESLLILEDEMNFYW